MWRTTMCIRDRHVAQAVEAIKKGYHILCEKPISPSLEECLLLQKTAHEYGRMVAVGHVLRYTPFYSKIKEVIESGQIGDVVSVQGIENVKYWHQAHSCVRGNSVSYTHLSERRRNTHG